MIDVTTQNEIRVSFLQDIRLQDHIFVIFDRKSFCITYSIYITSELRACRHLVYDRFRCLYLEFYFKWRYFLYEC